MICHYTTECLTPTEKMTLWSAQSSTHNEKQRSIEEESKTNKTPLPKNSGRGPKSAMAVQMKQERLWRKRFVEQMGFKYGFKG